MVFTQKIHLSYKDEWTKRESDRALKNYHDQPEHRWNLIHFIFDKSKKRDFREYLPHS